MNKTEWIWHKGDFVPWDQALTHVLTHTLHYGGGAFEGIRAYKTDKGGAIFRLKEHMERLQYSASALKMELPFSVDTLVEKTLELLRRNKLEQGYIRPLVYYGYGIMGLKPFGAPVEVMISCWPWGAYLAHDLIDVKISKYIRIHERSTVVDAKLCGHYVNSMLASIEIRGTKYHEALLLDSQGRVAEGPGENFFLIKDETILTPKLGTILAGITRNTVMTVAKDLGYKVVERDLVVDDIFKADEAFFTGTAAEIVPIRSVDDRVIGSGQVGKISAKIKEEYLNIVHGRNEKYRHYLHYL